MVGHDEEPGHRPVVGSQDVAAEREVGWEAVVDPDVGPGQADAAAHAGASRHLDPLERHGAAYVVMSGAHLPCVLRATAPTVYVRLHGPDHRHLYGGSYSDDDLRWWADRIREWSTGGHDVLVYLNNDGGGNAVRNARTLRWILGV